MLIKIYCIKIKILLFSVRDSIFALSSELLRYEHISRKPIEVIHLLTKKSCGGVQIAKRKIGLCFRKNLLCFYLHRI